MKLFPEVRFDVPRAQERFEHQLELMEIASRISSYGILFDDPLAALRLNEAQWRLGYMTHLFLQETGLPQEALGEGGTGATKTVRDYFWKTLGAPQLMFHKRTKAAQFNTPLLLEYIGKLPRDKGGDAALFLVGLRAAAKAIQFLQTYRIFAEVGNGRIYGGFNSLGTKGSRWSSSKRVEYNGAEFKMNLQNMPSKGLVVKRKGETPLVLAEPLHDLLKPDPGCAWLKFDFDAQEARLLAYVSKAAKLKEWIELGVDMHIYNACIMFEELVADGTLSQSSKKGDNKNVDDARDRAKGGMYGFSYQYAEDAASARYLDMWKAWQKSAPGLELTYVNKCASRLFKVHHEIPVMQQTLRASIDAKGYSEHPLSGDRLYLAPKEINGDYRGYNTAINSIPQSGGGHVFNLAIRRIAPQMSWQPGDTAILSLVHDELNAQAPYVKVDATMQIIRENMEAPFELYGEKVNLPAEASKGENWGALKKVKR